MSGALLAAGWKVLDLRSAAFTSPGSSSQPIEVPHPLSELRRASVWHQEDVLAGTRLAYNGS
jgi:hypothetical protein